MADKRKLEAEVSAPEMVNRRVDEELDGYDRAFAALRQLKYQEERDEEEARADAERYAAA